MGANLRLPRNFVEEEPGKPGNLLEFCLPNFLRTMIWILVKCFGSIFIFLNFHSVLLYFFLISGGPLLACLFCICYSYNICFIVADDIFWERERFIYLSTLFYMTQDFMRPVFKSTYLCKKYMFVKSAYLFKKYISL